MENTERATRKMERVSLSVWLDKHLRDQPWSSLELTENILVDPHQMEEITTCFEDGKIESRTKLRVLIALFGLSRQLLIDNGLEKHLLKLLSWVDKNERDEWVRMVGSVLSRTLTGNSSDFMKTKLESYIKTYRDSISGIEENGTSQDPYFLPLELAALTAELQPDPSAFHNIHFRLKEDKPLDFTLKRRTMDLNHPVILAPAGERKRPRPESSDDVNQEDTATPVVISEQVRSIIGEHSNLMTNAIVVAIEKFLAFLETGEEVDDLEKYKVHESIQQNEGETSIKESIYIVLDYKKRKRSKTKKTKKLPSHQ